jgi:hypothetical protein
MDTDSAKPRQRSTAPPIACAMISGSHGRCAKFSNMFREAMRSKPPMMAPDRSTLSCRAILILFVLIGIPSFGHSATLEESAKELARKIAAALPARENISCEIRNLSPLQPAEVARVEAALKTELQDRGIRIAASGAATEVVVTLSENVESLVWTGEIHQSEASQVVLLAVERPSDNRAFSGAMPVTLRIEKFWEGPERILDAAEISDGAGKSWLVLLLPHGLRIQDKQTGFVNAIEIASNQSVSRDPWGILAFGTSGSEIGFFLSPHFCSVDLETRDLRGCLPTEGSTGEPLGSRFPMMIDIAPASTSQPGKGTEISMGAAVCGGASQFLATGARDYTQTDSLQVFEMKSGTATAISAELNFPGPITALHTVPQTPRAVVRNLTTGNYEAYRLSFSCAQ